MTEGDRTTPTPVTPAETPTSTALRPSVTPGRRRIIVGLVALLAVSALVVVVTRKGDEGDAVTNGSGRAVVVTAGRSVVDPATGRPWTAVKGAWALDDGRLEVRKHDASSFSLLVTNGGTPNAVVIVRLPVLTTGAAVVFRFGNAFSYWMLRAVRHVASWQLVKVVNGRGTLVAGTGFSPVGNGTQVAITTRQDGLIGISFNGGPQQTYLDPELADRQGAGVAAIGAGASRAVFGNFTVTPTGPPGQ